MINERLNHGGQDRFFTKKTCMLSFIIFSFLLTAYILPQVAYHTIIRNSSIPSSPWQRSANQSSTYYNIPMPCLEPHCNIECFLTYGSSEKDEIIRSQFLSKIQEEHLMIDLGRDGIVQDLINFLPSSKLCQSISSSDNSTNITSKFYPISFGFVDQYLLKTIPRQVLLNNQFQTVNQICLPKKTKDFSDLIPGQSQTYKFAFENELDYRRLYSTAYFAITMKKGGWDCNRHYEIISSGTIPFFDQLNQTSIHTLALLPKLLLYQAQVIPGVIRQNLTINHMLFDINRYNLLLHRLLYYAQHRLTTIKIVEYILKVMKYPLISSAEHSILYISHEKFDYMKDLMLHGFTKVFAENLHVFQPPRYMYQYPLSRMWTEEQTRHYFGEKLYGFGYGYKLTLKNYVHLYERDRKELFNQMIVQNNIRMKIYSLIVFGSILRENSFFSLVKEYYEPSRIVLIDGEDDGKDSRRRDYAQWGTYFLREIPDDCQLIM